MAKALRSLFVSVAAKVAAFNSSMRSASASVGKFNRSGLKLKKSLGNINKAFQRMTGLGLGTAGAFLAVGAAVASAAKIVTNFDKAQSELRAISRANNEEMEALSDNAKKLGSSTAFTASEVSQLSTELARLGFDPSEIIAASAATLDLAAATGTELPQAAKQAGAAIRAFGLDASEAQRVADVFAEATASSALNMEFLDTAMSKVAPVARAFGFNIEETSALLGALADAGFDASTAATSTRSILLNLADANGQLAKELGRPIKSMKDLIPALKELDAKGVNLNDTLKLTDKRSVAAFQTFLKGTDSLETLTGKLGEAEGAAQRMADTMLDNVAGDLTKAQSAWEGLILSIEDGQGIISKAIRKVTQAFTSMLQATTKINEAPLEETFGKWGSAALQTAGLISPAFDSLLVKTADATIRAKELGVSMKKVTKAALFLAKSTGKDLATAMDGVLRKLEQQKNKLIATKKPTDDLKDSTFKLASEIKKEAKEAEKAAKAAQKLADKLKSVADKEAKAFTAAIIKAQKEVKKLFEFMKDPPEELKLSVKLDTPTVGKLEAGEDIQVKFTAKGLKKVETDWNALRGKIIQGTQQLAGAISTIWGGISEIISLNLENQEIALENKFAKEAEAINKSQKTQEQKDEALLELDKRMTKEKNKLAIKRAKSEKASALVGAIVNTALAVVGALASLPGPAGIVLAAIVGALGGVQIGLIASQPLPALGEGGILTKPTKILAGEAGPEAIIPLSKLGNLMGGKLEAVVRARDLVFVLDNENNAKSVNG